MTSHPQKRTLAFVARRLPEEPGWIACLRAFSDAVGAPLLVGVTNQVVHEELAAVDALREGFRSGALRPAYVLAHDSDAGLLTPEELCDEIRQNEHCVHQLLGADAPERRVLMLDAPVDEAAVAALEQHGIDSVVISELHEPVRIGERLVALGGVPTYDLGCLDAAGLARLAAEWRKSGTERVSPDELQRDLVPPWLARLWLAVPPLDERPGAAQSEVCGWLVDALGFARAPRLPPTALFDLGYRLERLPWRVRVPLLYRLARRRGGLQIPLARQLLELLTVEVELGARPEPRAPLAAWAQATLPDPSAYEELQKNGWRGRERWLSLLRTVAQKLEEPLTESPRTAA